LEAHCLEPFKVDLVEATQFPQRLVYTGLHADYSEDYFCGTELPEDEAGRIVCERLLMGNKGHWGPLEHPSLSLMIRADHNTMMQLRTHRVGCTFDYQSMRYTGKRIRKVAKGELDPAEVFYVRPPGIYWDRQGDKYEWTEDDVEEMLAMCYSSAIDYDRLRSRGASEEHARSVLATGYLQHGLISGSLRFWLHLLDVRAKHDAQLEVRQVMNGIQLQVQRWVPEIWSWYHAHRHTKAQLAP
jgi:thymidylate synthase (FAD)